MLVELRIRNFAVIQDLSVELGPGLNALTGETGAGKSIIVDALSLRLGERASSEVIRAGADRASVEAVFDLRGRPELVSRLDELGFEADDDLLVLRREVQLEGRNRAWINGSPATAGVVGEFGRALVDLHGQHEHQTLLHPSEQRHILDAFGGAEAEAAAVADGYARLSALKERLDQARSRRQEIAARADFLRFQSEEIEAAAVEPDEDARIDDELRRLEHAEELARDSEAVHALLYTDEGSVSDRLAQARELLRRLARFDPALEAARDEADELYHRAVELGRSSGSYASAVEVSPERAETLRRRVDLLFRLKGKYGPTLQDVLTHRDRIGAELSELDGSVFEIEGLERSARDAEEELGAAIEALSRTRTAASARLGEAVQAVLPELGMPGARFEIQLEPLDEPTAGGGERVRFLASLNPGFEPRPLARIASGGELSRVMLALKSILAREDRVPTLVFDEIDAGIGGTVAGAIARKLREVAEHHQVFVITHLAQLASRGHQHLRVEKYEREGAAQTAVEVLEGEGRIREIARMLGGDPESQTSRDHARELLAAG
jgi:DNA repair protein RecN (Recombination protein N)